jgi:hypothetical protein
MDNEDKSSKDKKIKTLLKWLFVLIILGLLVYVFRDSAGPIARQLYNTSPMILLLILLATLLYGVCESIITYILVKPYNKNFTFKQAWGMTYFCAFYRAATLGSGAGVAAIVYLSKYGMKSSEACGMYVIDYSIHKLSVAIMAALMFLLNWKFMIGEFADYKFYLILGFVATIIITSALMLFACAAWFHKLLYKLMDLVNFKGRFTETFDKVRKECVIMENASKKMLKNKKNVASIILINFAKFSFWFMIPYIVLYKDMDMSFVTSMAVAAVSVMLAAVIPTPAGIGSSEFVLIMMFGGIAGEAAAGAMSLLYRFATFVFPCLVGAAVAARFAAVKGKTTNDMK